jgi:phospholipid/cholesterol/gamma-HCH transport system substrate-binding protein
VKERARDVSPYRRNVLVGVTVLAALGILGWMMIQFGGSVAKPFAPRHVPIHLRALRADGLAEGSGVFFKGVQVGQVLRVYRVAEDPLWVHIDAEVEPTPPIPANVQGLIRVTSALGGGAVLDLEMASDSAIGTISSGTQLEAIHAGTSFLPPEFAELATELRATVRQFNETNVVGHLDEEVRRVGRLVDSVQELVGDEQMRADLKASLANIRSTTEKADRLAGRLEQLSGEASETMAAAKGAIGRTESEIVGISRQLGERLTQIAKLVDQFQAISTKIDQGQGTAGKLINDDRLYESLVVTAQQLQATVTDLRRLIQQWEQEGVHLRLR